MLFIPAQNLHGLRIRFTRPGGDLWTVQAIRCKHTQAGPSMCVFVVDK